MGYSELKHKIEIMDIEHKYEIEKIKMPTPWGTTYTLEQMLEHAIVHILRHRRQIERLLQTTR